MATTFSFFEIERHEAQRTAIVWLNRPDKRNAMNGAFWRELPELVQMLDADAVLYSVIVMGRGEQFSTGLDLFSFYQESQPILHGGTADIREQLMHHIVGMQKGMAALVKSPKVWIGAPHGWCIGAGLDLIAACDLRIAAADVKISLREARVAIVADMGVLSRLPGIVGQANARLMALTARDFTADDALRMNLVSAVYPDAEALKTAALQLAAEVALNSGIALRGTKKVLEYVEEHGPDAAMDYVGVWNAAFLDSPDFREMIQAFVEKRAPKYQ